MEYVEWKRFSIWRFELRTNNTGWWFGISYNVKSGDPVYDVTVSKYGIHYQKLPF